jgi:hypothetical protein
MLKRMSSWVAGCKLQVAGGRWQVTGSTGDIKGVIKKDTEGAEEMRRTQRREGDRGLFPGEIIHPTRLAKVVT